ncbi:hypothetical protein B0H11DRAFT_2010671 [Mycena galericulata]|nr:hypothetical protein B0H11DRAFT_2010671 [Mycena galericulata]
MHWVFANVSSTTLARPVGMNNVSPSAPACTPTTTSIHPTAPIWAANALVVGSRVAKCSVRAVPAAARLACAPSASLYPNSKPSVAFVHIQHAGEAESALGQRERILVPPGQWTSLIALFSLSTPTLVQAPALHGDTCASTTNRVTRPHRCRCSRTSQRSDKSRRGRGAPSGCSHCPSPAAPSLCVTSSLQSFKTSEMVAKSFASSCPRSKDVTFWWVCCVD